MGRDHTIYATEHGYVKYYKDPEKHPKRQYIGVTFERDQVLPLPRNAMRRRKLNMIAQKIEQPAVTLESEVVVAPSVVLKQNGKKKERRGEEGRRLTLRPGGMFRESNWEIGRAAERAQVKVRAFKPRDRWVAWRKAARRQAAIADKKSLGRKIKKSK